MMNLSPRVRWRSLAMLAAFCLFPPVLRAEHFAFHHEGVLGTSLELVLDCSSEQTAQAAEVAVLAEIERLDKVLSSYRSDSEFEQWTRGAAVEPMSADLRKVLLRAEHWREMTLGAFDVRAAAVTALYQRASPSLAERRHALVAQLKRAPYTDGAELSRADTLPLSLNAIAKGYILDRASQVGLQQDGSVGCLINIGGDLRVVGTLHSDVGVADPLNAAENAAPIAQVRLAGGQAMATSGTYRRHVKGQLGQVNHLFDPRTALPVDSIVSASVIADTAMDADALATAMSVLTPAESLKLADTAQVACLVIDRQGRQFVSERWPTLATAGTQLTSTADEEQSERPDYGLFVDFTLAAKQKGGRYRRPYVAVWLEDKEGFPVKTAVLWLQTTGPGPRWHRDLTRWYRNDRIRKLAEDVDLIDTISAATRGPGEYSAHFDGTDNRGKPLPAGEYTLCIEVAREHGTYQLLRKKIAWGAEPIAKQELPSNPEVSAASLWFLPEESKVQ